MARKRTKGKKATQTASARGGSRTAVKKPRKPVSKTSRAKPGSQGAVDLLRSWSPSRYSR
jgi:hypothetical protein